MNAIILLFVTGVALLAAEIFLPGIIAGIIGALCMLAGCVISFNEFGAGGGTLATVVALALLGLTLYLELVWLPKTAFGKRLVVQSKVDAVSQPPLANPGEVVGKAAEAVTTLAPSGYVLVEGRRYEAFCRSGHVPKGAVLRVIGIDNFRVIVTQT
ncbi:MAG: NfeD family protein [bacterium]|nr:NfeD family protein [bacterium]MDI1334813.1 NfeD family protein [Lacunisphaera sp.]